jgi:hypothetical protein
MANSTIQIKRTSVAGRAANSTTLPNPGELAINMADRIMYSTNGTSIFEIGANNTNVRVTGNATIKAIIANSTIGSAGQALFTNGTGIYWNAAPSGTGGSSNLAIQNSNPVSPNNGVLYWNSDLGKLLLNYNDGDTEQWVEPNLSGQPGPVGANGIAASISVGTTTTLAPLSVATVTNSGDSTTAVFDFGIPRGSTVAVNSAIVTVLPSVNPSISVTSNATIDNVVTFSLPRATRIAVNTAVTTVLPAVNPSVSITSNATFDNVISFSLPRAVLITANQSVVTAVPGTPASVSVTSNATFDNVVTFTIPRGSTVAVNTNVTTVEPAVNPSISLTSNATFDNVISFSLPRATKIAVNSAITVLSPSVDPSIVVASNSTFDNVINFSLPRATRIAVNTNVTTVSPTTNPSVSITSNATFDNVISFSLPRASTVAVNSAVVVGSPGSAPSVSVTSNSTFDNVITFTLSTGAVGPTSPKAISIPSPQAGDNFTMFWTNTAITLQEIRTVVQGTTPSVDASFFWGTSRGTGTTISANVITTNVTNGNTLTSFSNSTPAAGSFLWITINAVTGTVSEYHATLRF